MVRLTPDDHTLLSRICTKLLSPLISNSIDELFAHELMKLRVAGVIDRCLLRQLLHQYPKRYHIQKDLGERERHTETETDREREREREKGCE